MTILKHYSPPNGPLDILHLDEHMIVLNKPSGLLSVPGKHTEHKDCLESRVQAEFSHATTVHRLDMETSGILVMALNKHAHRYISRGFEDRKTDKTYMARVDGIVAEDEGSIDLHLICDWRNRPRQMVDHDKGKSALTNYKVMEREHAATRLALYPVTGRSHQLRVHCLSMGHEILGDPLYGRAETIKAADRLQLHATSLTIFHPETQEKITFNSKVPF